MWIHAVLFKQLGHWCALVYVQLYLHVGGPASVVLWLGPPGCSAASPFLLSVCRPHHHKVHAHLARLDVHKRKAIHFLVNTYTTTSWIISSLTDVLCNQICVFYVTADHFPPWQPLVHSDFRMEFRFNFTAWLGYIFHFNTLCFYRANNRV